VIKAVRRYFRFLFAGAQEPRSEAPRQTTADLERDRFHVHRCKTCDAIFFGGKIIPANRRQGAA
jgi:hypothetical protein